MWNNTPPILAECYCVYICDIVYQWNCVLVSDIVLLISYTLVWLFMHMLTFIKLPPFLTFLKNKYMLVSPISNLFLKKPQTTCYTLKHFNSPYLSVLFVNIWWQQYKLNITFGSELKKNSASYLQTYSHDGNTLLTIICFMQTSFINLAIVDWESINLLACTCIICFYLYLI